MAEKWKLKRTRQCAKCPWRVDVNPHDIPNGYTVEKHRALAATIAKPGDVSGIGKELNVMVCHESVNAYCVGWLGNQLNEGNNLALRVRMLGCANANRIKTIGRQHGRFEDTLPVDARTD